MDRIISYIILLAVCVSCARSRNIQQPAGDSAATEPTELKLGGNKIDVTRIAGKGKIMSRRILPVYSVVDGVISDISLIEGQKVRKGQLLVKINDMAVRLRISELESELEKKRYEVVNTCIGLGYKRDAIDAIPKEVMDNVESLTGYTYTKVLLENEKKQLETYVIKAPFDGSVFNVNVDKLFYARRGEPLFYIMDTENLLVRFEVVETQLTQYSIGMPLEFSTLAYPDRIYHAKLISIAPNVETSGMVVMAAKITGEQDGLRPGMTALVNL